MIKPSFQFGAFSLILLLLTACNLFPGNQTSQVTNTIGNQAVQSIGPSIIFTNQTVKNNRLTLTLQGQGEAMINGINGTLTYDPAKLQFLNLEATAVTKESLLTSDVKDGQVTLAWASSKPIAWDKSDLLEVHFLVLNQEPTSVIFSKLEGVDAQLKPIVVKSEKYEVVYAP